LAFYFITSAFVVSDSSLQASCPEAMSAGAT
jgi:hypothetical protein